MITKNFKMLVAGLLQGQSGSTKGVLPVKTYNGNTVYVGHTFTRYSFPVSNTFGVVFSANAGGIKVGSGNTAPTENDYMLESLITSGLTAGTMTFANGVDVDGNPYADIQFDLTNTTAEDIVIKEIGYFGSASYSSTLEGNISTSGSNTYILLDRTVLETPVTVPANGTATIKYTLKTILPT